MRKLGLVFWLLAAVPLAHAEGPAKKPKPKDAGTSKMKMDLGLPSFGKLPTGADLQKAKAKPAASEPTVTPAGVTYSVVRVQHAKSFLHTANGAMPMGGSLAAIPIVGNPPSTDKFTTVIRMKATQRVNAPIDVVILDPRGDTAMQATGELSFRGQVGNEADYTVDWEKTPTRAGGKFEVLVRVAGQVMGTWPLQVGEPPKPEKEAAADAGNKG